MGQLHVKDVSALIVVGALLFAFGAYMFYRGISAGPQIALDAGEMETGKATSGRWLKVHGIARWDLQVQISGKSRRRIVPVVSQQWQPGHPVAVFLEMLTNTPEPSHAAVLQDFEGTFVIGRT